MRWVGIELKVLQDKDKSLSAYGPDFHRLFQKFGSYTSDQSIVMFITLTCYPNNNRRVYMKMLQRTCNKYSIYIDKQFLRLKENFD
jgi:hypothetical protein